ncbi:MAG TPA: isoprenylcysteine carboxylmethyltransferase family protein [Pyrinomonadaceae bacterium]|nr:isoprenylcysteine carboxylmethyltransferase family protein [Pyrinomonadaceae bacterium]
MIRLNFWPTLAFVVMLLSWFAFVIAFLFHQRPPSPPDKKRDPTSIVGIIGQALSYSVVWAVRRPWFTPMFAGNRALEIILAVVTMMLAAASVWFCAAAIRALGEQWSLAARVVEGHKLVTRGPYSIVRNPIYTGMLGMLLATGLAVSHWMGIIMATVMFAIGTFIRVRSEEKLLREMFGREFDDYARRVPAVIPLLV